MSEERLSTWLMIFSLMMIVNLIFDSTPVAWLTGSVFGLTTGWVIFRK